MSCARLKQLFGLGTREGLPVHEEFAENLDSKDVSPTTINSGENLKEQIG